MSLEVVGIVVQKNRLNQPFVGIFHLGYVEVFPLQNCSSTHLYHHLLVCWTSEKSHFRRESFPTFLTSDVPKSTHWEPVSMLRRLLWWWTSHIRCMQLLWAVLCHVLHQNASFWASNTSQNKSWAHVPSGLQFQSENDLLDGKTAVQTVKYCSVRLYNASQASQDS